ncbi:MAG: hypothetical protein ACI4QT_10680, partial [Kiritimatiellia bacterium]
QARKDASRRLKLNIITEQICRTKKLTLSQEEFNAFLLNLMRAQNINHTQMESICKDQATMRNLYQMALQQKVLSGYLDDLTKKN